MKRIIILVIGFIVCSNFIFAQECNYEKNVVDKFTGQRSILTKAIKVGKGSKTSNGIKVDKIEFQLKLDKEKRILSLVLTINGGSISMKGDEKLLFLLGHDNNIELKYMSKPATNTANHAGLTYTYDYIIDEPNYETFLLENIKDVRVNFADGSFDFSILPDVSTKKIFKCIK